MQWPPGRSAYTVVLASYPSTTGQPTAMRFVKAAAAFVLTLVWSGAPGDSPDLSVALDRARALT